jgi:hypothetical protein
MWEKPVTTDVSQAKPAWFSPFVSATALAIPDFISYHHRSVF